ncbi:MAG TPA: hypothetical protein VH816_00015 [Gaiellaceae bacterium]
MKRHIVAVLLATLCSLVVVGTAAAWDSQTPPPPPVGGIEQGQGNASEQKQVQVVPIAPQLNVQNVNVGTSGNVQQGDANNANTGQADQQQNTQVAVQDGGNGKKDEHCSCDQAPPPPSSDPEQHLGSSSEQGQVQVVPIAPQANVQNVNVLTGDDVRQGDANNANTGQANQQENTQIAVQQGGGAPDGGQSQAVDQGQGNQSSQGQVQVVPIAPQANVQNVNVFTSGDVEQGDANNANTGQANQQHNTQVAVQKGSGGPSHGGCDCSSEKRPSTGSRDSSVSQHQGNWSKQEQAQIVPVAPQLNVQNVNVGTHGDVDQGDANNANTGQANQQENTQVAVQEAGSPKHPAPGKHGCKPAGKPEPPSPGGQRVKQHQGNWSKQKQIQFVPIAPQASFQNVNLFTHGKVSQGDANNANTGQANQQHNTQFAWLQQGLPHGNPDGYGENARR